MKEFASHQVVMYEGIGFINPDMLLHPQSSNPAIRMARC